MFLKRGRPDITPGVVFLTTRVKEPNEGNWVKLVKCLGFSKGTTNDVLTLKADDTQELNWYIDLAFAVHDGMKSRTGATLTLKKGCIITKSTKQTVNTSSSTEA
eukprot:5197908-Ditylum_brightwellii.AAC.1